MTVHEPELASPTSQPVAEDMVFGGLSLRPHTLLAARSRVHAWAALERRDSLTIGFLNPHVYNVACGNRSVATYLEGCDVVCIDGVGVKLASLVFHGRTLPRVVATDLLEDLLRTLDRRLDALLIGTTQKEVEAAAREINARSRGVRVTSTLDGFRELAEYQAFFRANEEFDAVLVGAGSPRSETILLEASRIYGEALLFHIGAGTIKLFAGTKRRSPRLMSRLGLEWMHRFIFEPHTRPRYLSGGWLFAKELVKSRLKGGSLS